MATQSERPSKRPSHSSQSPPANEKVSSSFREKLVAHFGKFSIAFGALSFVVWLACGYVLGKCSPQYMVTVEPFEISSEVGSRTLLSGKSASDIVVDIVNDVASHASKFHGIDYYNYVGAGVCGRWRSARFSAPGHQDSGSDVLRYRVERHIDRQHPAFVRQGKIQPVDHWRRRHRVSGGSHRSDTVESGR